MDPTHDVSDGREYDQAILRWRATPSRTNYALREQARRDYYASLRGYALLEEEPARV